MKIGLETSCAVQLSSRVSRGGDGRFWPTSPVDDCSFETGRAKIVRAGIRVALIEGVGPKGVDRTVRDVDVIEHVIKGVRTDRRPTDERSNLTVQTSWLGGEVLSRVRVTVLPDEEIEK